MKAYVVVTGTLFVVLTLLHLARSVELWHRFAEDPGYVVSMALLTILSAVLSVWAGRLLLRLRRSPGASA
jgi:hypothetical protein